MHSPTLFTHADGSPVLFCLRHFDARRRYVDYITRGGGAMAEVTAKGVLVLVAPGAALVPGKDNVKLNYIDACVWQNKLLPVDGYVYEMPVRYVVCSCWPMLHCFHLTAPLLL